MHSDTQDFQQLLSHRAANIAPSFIREILKVAQQPGVISFAGGLPNETLFPLEAIRVSTEAVLAHEGYASLQYSNTEGHSGLREWIAERYRRRFGLTIPVESILITNGSQQALDLLGKVLLNPGDDLGMEQPGYLGAIQAFGFYQPRFLPLALNHDGIDVAALEQLLKVHQPKLLYTVPNFQNPTGITYSAENRNAIAALLQGKKTLLIEDDPYGELRYSGEPAPSFKQLLPDQTLLLGSFSKTVLPSFRLGWIVAPPWLIKKLIIAKQSSDLHTCGFTQRVLFRYLNNNEFDQHLHSLIHHYGNNLNVMLRAMEQYCPSEVTFTRPDGGMFIWATLPQQLSAMSLFERAIDRHIAFVPGDPFMLDNRLSHSMRLNFTNSHHEELTMGIAHLAQIIEESL